MKEYERGFHILRHKAPSEAFLIHVLQRNISNVAASQRNCSKLVSTQDTAPMAARPPCKTSAAMLPIWHFPALKSQSLVDVEISHSFGFENAGYLP